MKKCNKIYAMLLALSTSAFAHHGVPSISLAGVEGPGAPLETTSSSTLPEGSLLAYLKVDHAKYKTYTSARDGEAESSDYFMYGLGYGFNSYFSAYVFVPYYVKSQDDAFSTSGFHDISFQFVLGMKYDDGLMLTPGSESLDDMQDWHFTTSFSFTLPTGKSDATTADGSLIDSGMQTGFGEPSFMFGVSATKWFGNDWTLVGDMSYNTFLENTHFDGTKVDFGDEFRVNTALSYMLYSKPASKLRLDLNIEANYMHLGRDIENGRGAEATGGEMIYLTPGARLSYKTTSVAVGVKIPTWTNLNEEDLQQGAEGKEDYRLLFTFSSLF
ncbi:MAG: transporter [Sulfurimonas sp.]|uniref:transporter n=1 Tax=Sulfurimonas sp. TaxID=2022749 RepID=UPI0025FDC21A|nr:transporter [Sulfurimonas sp.]MCK9491636.1 transporter [Sulfurimonas sp.]